MKDDRERQTGGASDWAPRDSELVTIKAARLIGEAPVIAYHCARHGNSIAGRWRRPSSGRADPEERLMYPVTTGPPTIRAATPGRSPTSHQSARGLVGRRA